MGHLGRGDGLAGQQRGVQRRPLIVRVRLITYSGGQQQLLDQFLEAFALAVAGGVYDLLGGADPFELQDTPAFAVAALVFFLGNTVLVETVISLAHGRDFVADLKDCLRADALPYAMAFALAPILLVVAEQSIALLPPLLLLLFAVRDAQRAADEAEERRIAAELAADEAKAVAAEKVRLVEAERALVERLRESDRPKDDLPAAVSHELRTPWPACWGRWPP